MESKITLPRARELDVDREIELIEPLLQLLPGGTNDENLAIIRQEVCRHGTVVFVIDAPFGAVAFMSLSYPHLRRVGLLEHVAVHADFRRQRLATILFEKVESFARDAGLHKLCAIVTSSDGMKFAMAQGFSVQAMLPSYLGSTRNVVWLDRDIPPALQFDDTNGAEET